MQSQSIKADLTFAAAGDAMMTRRASTFEHDGFLSLVERIRSADASFVNLEVTLHDFEGYPTAHSTGTYMRAPPWVADELQWCGFDVVAAANNHTFDYSHGGVEATMRELESREIPYAGLGRNLAEARAPAYVDTPAGRIAVVGACSTINPGSEAGEQRRDMPGRPGLSPLRFDVRYTVPEEALAVLQEMSENLGLEALKRRYADLGVPLTDPEDDSFRLLVVDGNRHPAIDSGDEYQVRLVPNEDDIDAIKRQIAAATRQADWVIASLHAHEGEGPRTTDPSTAPFIESFARTCVDAGADVFVGHGAHVIRGMEVYDGAPIFHCLGNLFAGNDLVERLPAESYEMAALGPEAGPVDYFDERSSDDEGNPAGFLTDSVYWESILPVVEFEDGELTAVQVYPIDLLFDEPRSRRGRPVPATGEKAQSILDDLAALSEPYGTEIAIENGVGGVVLG